jgi:hypothetical protein
VDTPSDQLKLLSDYTLFHIGLYTTLITALTSLVHFGRLRNTPCLLKCVAFTVICFLVAGASGGVIASNIPNYSRFADYDQARLDVFGIPCLSSLRYRTWAHIEHISFWVGLLFSVVGILVAAFHPKCAEAQK